MLSARGVGVIEVRGEPVTKGYTTVAGFIAAQDEQGWYDTGDLGYLTETGNIVVCGRAQGRHHHGRPQHLPDRHRARRLPRRRGSAGLRGGGAAGRRALAGDVRRGGGVQGVRQTLAEVRRIEHQVAHEVFAEVDVRPRNVVVLAAGDDPQDPVGQAAARPRAWRW